MLLKNLKFTKKLSINVADLVKDDVNKGKIIWMEQKKNLKKLPLRFDTTE